MSAERAGDDEHDEAEEPRPDRALRERVDRAEDPGAGQERAEERERRTPSPRAGRSRPAASRASPGSSPSAGTPSRRATASARRSRPGPRRSSRPSRPPGRPSASRAAGRRRGRPGDERPAARRDDPALVGATCEQRAHREGERDREADVAEVEQRRVGHHVRVLEARVEPAPSAGAACVANGVATTTSRKAKKTATPPSTGVTQATRSRARAPVDEQGGGRVAGQDQQPEQQRALLPAPEGRDRVAGRQLAARVLGGVDEREVVADQRRDEDERGDDARPEGRDERVLGREREPAAAPPGRVASRRRPRRPRGPARRRARRGRAQASTWTFLAVYFDGHFVTSESLTATKMPLRSSPLTETSRPARNWSGDRARVDDRDRLRRAALDVAEPEAKAARRRQSPL